MHPSAHRGYPAYLRAFVLVLLLVAAQLGALAHALGHLKGDDSQGRVPESYCEWCGAYTQSGSAVPSAPVAPHFAAAFALPESPWPDAPARPVAFSAYLSQAPPPLS